MDGRMAKSLVAGVLLAGASWAAAEPPRGRIHRDGRAWARLAGGVRALRPGAGGTGHVGIARPVRRGLGAHVWLPARRRLAVALFADAAVGDGVSERRRLRPPAVHGRASGACADGQAQRAGRTGALCRPPRGRDFLRGRCLAARGGLPLRVSCGAAGASPRGPGLDDCEPPPGRRLALGRVRDLREGEGTARGRNATRRSDGWRRSSGGSRRPTA